MEVNENILDRTPPFSIEAEQSVIGSMILDWQVIPEVLDVIPYVHAEAFYKPAHLVLFQTIVRLYDTTGTLDNVQIVQSLRDGGILEQVGGADYIVSLVESVPVAMHGPYYAKIVRDKWMLRRVLKAAGELTAEGYENADVQEVVAKAQRLLFGLIDAGSPVQVYTLGELMQETLDAMQNGEDTSGLKTAWPSLNEKIFGLGKGQMIVIGARPRHGKTALALNVAAHAAITNSKPVAFFSLEMTRLELAQRLVSTWSGVPAWRIACHQLREEHIDAIKLAADAMSKSPLYIIDKGAMSILEIRSQARRLKAQYHIEAVFIDYLQLCRGDGRDRREQVGSISNGAKALAKELDLPVVMLSQLNRKSEDREDRRPELADLRESGDIEQDADKVILMNNLDAVKFGDPDFEPSHKVELYIAKHRNGPQGKLELRFDGETMRFDEFAQGPGLTDENGQTESNRSKS